MSEYGVTDRGFVLKRMDTILEEIHADLTEGFGFDTSLQEASFLNVLVTTFAGQIADLWETAQDSYYQKYPATAKGLNLDHAVQYGGIRREAARQTYYMLHCTGEDGTVVPKGTMVATDTKPEIRLCAKQEFILEREHCNAAKIRVASVEANTVYSFTINGEQYNYSSQSVDEMEILVGLQTLIKNSEYKVEIDREENLLIFQDTVKGRSNTIVLSDNLTTKEVTTIASFFTEEYGSISIPNGLITRIITNVTGLIKISNRLLPVYGRLQETDVELRQSYIAKSALRSNTMVDSVVAELLNNVADVETAVGYQNETDVVDSRGLAPHSIELIVEGGDNTEIATAILKRKAGGIQTNGAIATMIPGKYGESIEVRFHRPEYLYTFLRITLHGEAEKLPINYDNLTIESILEDTKNMKAGDSLLVQLLNEGIYSRVAGIHFVDIETAYSKEASYVPSVEDYQLGNILVTLRQKVRIQEDRIEVVFLADS